MKKKYEGFKGVFLMGEGRGQYVHLLLLKIFFGKNRLLPLESLTVIALDKTP